MTTTTTIEARTSQAWAALETALRQRQAVNLSYHGRRRSVSPHALGWKNGKAMLLAYQTSSDTTPPAPPADPTGKWRCFYLDQIEHIDADPTTKWATADTYNPARPFNTIDHVAIAITPAKPAPNQPVG